MCPGSHNCASQGLNACSLMPDLSLKNSGFCWNIVGDNVALVSGVQQSASVMLTHPLFFRFFSHIQSVE